MSNPTDIRSGRLDAATLVDNFSDLHPRLTGLQATVESSRCLFCFDAPCTEACPTGIDIPGFIRQIGSGNIQGAAVTILRENIMGATCANVCPVEELCEQVCVKQSSEHKPVSIGQLQRFATDHLFDRRVQPFKRQPESGCQIAVVGAGPAGLSCAHRLAMYGHQVTVYEAREKAGGLNEFGLAAYKMLDQRAAREIDFILAIGGIEIQTGKKLGQDFSLAELRDRYDAVFLGLGHNAVNSLGLDNEGAAGVVNAVDYIARLRQEALDSLPVGRNVIVIGGGNTAIDIAVQSRKLGAEGVTLVYRRGRLEMGATDYEQELAQTCGVLIRTWAQPHQLLLDGAAVSGVRFERTEKSPAGGLQGTGEYFDLPADMVFKAIGQQFDPSQLNIPATELPEVEHGRFRVDENRRTSLPDVYAGGDCIAGRDLTVVAVQDGKLAAEAIHQSFTENADG